MSVREAISTDQVDLDLLEPLLKRFAELIGLSKTMVIVEMWGGLQLYVAKNPPVDGDLANVIGLEPARQLGDEFGGEHLAVPKAMRALRALRDTRIRDEHSTKSIRQLCIDHGLTERRVCQILDGGDSDEDQPGLFD